MKADYAYNRKTISGKIGKFVLLRWKDGDKAVVKRYVKPKLGENNQQFGNALKNISAIWKECSDGYKADLRIYADRLSEYYHADDIPARTNYAHFIRLIYRFKQENPEIDLSSTTREELESAGIPVTVASIVHNKLLPEVHDAAVLINEW